MPDPPGMPSALGIEAVEVVETGGQNVTIRVTGRWARHRRLAWRGRPLLLVEEEEGRRHRFTAIPEPPSISGAAPGTWQVSFSVPASLAEDLAGRAWVQVGSTVVPLPPIAGRAARPPRPSAALSSEREPQAPPEREATTAQDPDRRRLLAELDQTERLRRLAEQRAHAEQSLRIELEEQLAERDRQLAEHHAVLAELAAAEEQLRLAREAEAAAVEPAEERDLARASRLQSEASLVRRALNPGPMPARGGWRPRSSAAALGLERKLIAGRGAGGERMGVVLSELEQRLADHGRAASRRESTIDELRAELVQLATAVELEVEAREAAERALAQHRQRTANAIRTLAELRAIVAGLRGRPGAPEPGPPKAGAPEPGPPEPGAAEAGAAEPGPPEPAAEPAPEPSSPTAIEAERLDAALTRLRQAAPEPVEPEPPARAVWLKPALGRLVKRDPATAGALLRALRPDVAAGVDPAALARLVAAGPLRWRLGGARHRSSAAAVLRAFVREPRPFGRLATDFDPVLALTLVAAMIDPAWTTGERFTVGHRGAGPETYLRIRDGRAPVVAPAPPLGPVATTITCRPEELVALLAGQWPAAARISGSRQRVELIQTWVRRAQGI